MKKNKITEIDGWGTLHRRRTSIDVKDKDGDTTSYTFDNLIIATGATARLLPGMKLSEHVVTYEEQILTDELPGSIIIAGSGAIGVEFAYVMKNFGVDVTIVEFLDRMVPDRGRRRVQGAAQALQEARREGAALDQGRVASRTPATSVKVTVSPAGGGDQQVLEADKVLAGHRVRPARRGLRPRGRPASSSPSAARSRSTSAAAPTSTTSTRSVTSPGS